MNRKIGALLRHCAMLLAILSLGMAPLWAEGRYTAATALRLRVGPFVSPTDGVTLLPSLTVANLTIRLWQPPQYTTIANQVTNGTFASATVWTVGAGCSITGGVLSCTTATSATTQAIACVQNVAYRIKVTAATATAGSFVVSGGGGTAGAAHSTAATFADVVVCGATGLIAITFTGFSGTLDDVEVEQWPMTITAASSASANDMVYRDGGNYEIELTAAQTAIPGTHDLCFTDPTLYVPFCQTYEFEAPASFAANVQGVLATTTGIRDSIINDATTFAGAKINSLTFTNVGKVDANTLQVGGTTQTAADVGAMATDLRSVAQVYPASGSATAAAGGASTITLDGSAPSTKVIEGQVIQTLTGAGALQSRVIVSYNTGTRVATVNRPWAVNPDGTTTFRIVTRMAP